MSVRASTALALENGQPRAQPKLVVFYAPRDGKCRRVDGYLSQVLQRRQNHTTFTLVRVDAERRPDLAARFKITELPTLVVIDDNRVLGRLSRPRGCKQITELLDPWLA
ncbi:MAG: thioredoxin family protein [Gaiellaceae bacterium]